MDLERMRRVFNKTDRSFSEAGQEQIEISTSPSSTSSAKIQDRIRIETSLKTQGDCINIALVLLAIVVFASILSVIVESSAQRKCSISSFIPHDRDGFSLNSTVGTEYCPAYMYGAKKPWFANSTDILGCLEHGDGQWNSCFSVRPLYQILPHCQAEWCSEARFKQRGQDWRWKPVCQDPMHKLAPYNTSLDLERRVCWKLHRRHILMVGDSVMSASFVSMFSLLGLNNPFVSRGRKETISVCRKFGYDVRLSFAFNEHLLLDANLIRQKESADKDRILVDWTQLAHRADVIVMNRGLHRVTSDVFTRELIDTLAVLGNKKLIYRSTTLVPGECREGRSQTFVDTTRGLDNLGRSKILEDQNHIARRIVRLHGPNAHFLNVSLLTVRRGDSTEDCVHYCNPGPLDDVNILTLRMLDAMFP